MATNGVAGAGGGAEASMSSETKGALAVRPTITLPPRSSFERLFWGGGGASEVSPGPLTLVSSFFADDPESECRSFTQLLVGAMNSPAARRTVGFDGELGKEGERSSAAGAAAATAGGGGGADVGGGVGGGLGQNRPPSLMVSQPAVFTVPPGLSPGGLLDSPALFWPGMGNFAMSHQEALAQVTAQAAQSPFRISRQTEFPPPFSVPASTLLPQQPGQEISNPKASSNTFQSTEDSQSDQVSQPMGLAVDKPTDDGYNWRKYGQKMVKGSEYPRSYYKCTYPNCVVTKKVERSVDGHVTEIIYKGQHNHQRPTNKRSKQGSLPNGSMNGNIENSSISEVGSLHHHEDSRKQSDITSGSLISKRDRESGHGMPDQVSGSSDSEEVAEIRVKEGGDTEPDLKRRNLSASSQRTLTEPRIIVQTTSEVDLLDDGYRWRKYGQKVVKGNPNPRSYYKCTYTGCNVRKHIERSSTDPKAVITTYEGKHNHELPASRNSSHSMAAASAALNIASFGSRNFGNNDKRPVAVLELKEEHEVT